MKIGIDFDGVVADCGRLKTFGAKELYGVDIAPEKFKKEIVVGEGHLTSEQYRTLQKTIYGTREIGFQMEPVLGALEYTHRLIAEGYEITVVTSRSHTELDIAWEWSLRRGFTLNFIGVGHGNSKADAAQGLTCYIDDDLDKLEPLRDIVPHRFLFSWGYNAHEDTRDIACRVPSWKDFYEAIQQLNGAQ